MVKCNFLAISFCALVLLTSVNPLLSADSSTHWWNADVDKALASAGENRAELQQALEQVPAEQRKGMAFLIANMPDQDLRELPSSFLLTNCRLAYETRSAAPWGKSIPEGVFLNDVLPYANLDEERDDWRLRLHALSMPIIQGCKTPSTAALKLNKELFPQLEVKYSTSRRAPNQGPAETMESGVASCTGLSILLVDACRAVGIPARVVGTPLWTDKRGNHTWVEIWDDGWHFTGACEAGDANSLDEGWFVGDAAKAQEDVAEHAIYAASFQKTQTPFPMVWADKNNSVSAVNVTRSYAPKQPVESKTAKLWVRVVRSPRERAAVPVEIRVPDGKEPLRTGISKDETADLNDYLEFDLPPGREFAILVAGTRRVIKSPAAGASLLIEIQLPTDSK
ncbi:transglutaminase-like domain-containing protein [Blastopirellula sp. JC732]|uniref:Transglutaminase-like domain-containing protein n=1 Tax=Blastopirellula sediminis TaxID=2894196 RepID=A0A9X1MNY6_9BACT|nr:transglutaminase-like domain-containing protein [Blastopirellula sediminis]MCC9606958.1 transglutaminase-like domain-containing protein [Blastopirellula sediminis]MCC9629747.1 transglutaminase-like domain-containing protein [Blastopirellula sediminis]